MAQRNTTSNRSRSRGGRGPSRSDNNNGGANTSVHSGGSSFRQTSRDAARRSRETVTNAADAALDTVMRHPYPAALIGAGVAWLLLETRPARRAERKLLRRAKRAAETIGEPFSGVPRAARSAFAESAEHSRDSVREGAGALAEYAQESVAAIGHTAQRGYMRGRETLTEQWERHPLAMGLALLAAGLATGMLLPSSRKEGEAFGRASDDLSRRVKETGTEILERGRELVDTSRRAVERASRREGLSPATVGKKMRRVVKRAARAATKE